MRRLIIGGAGSGCGKTTVCCAVLAALKNRGLRVSATKCGPDYIDPMFHERAIGIPFKNIDLYFTKPNEAKFLLNEHAAGSDICIIEGVMGYYDGLAYDNAQASTYDTAKATDTSAVLVVNAKGAAYTLSAIIKGIADFKENSGIKAVILNNVSEMVYKGLKPVIEAETGIEAVGYMPYNSEVSFDSRHLGLVTPTDDVVSKLNILGETAEKTIDIDRLLEIAGTAGDIEFTSIETKFIGSAKIAVAMDSAFCFYYKDNFELLKKMGAEITFFSPLEDKSLPEGTDGIILGGGYPELYAEKLAENRPMLESIRESIETGMPCLAECGGFMYLSKAIDGKKMAGVFDGEAKNTGRLSRFGYIKLKSDLPFLDGIKGHEFHYWDTDNNGSACTAVKPSGKRSWPCMHVYKNTVAGYPHLYYYSKPEFAAEFMRKCLSWRN